MWKAWWLALLVSVTPAVAAAEAPVITDTARYPDANLPLSFVANGGHADPRVRFVAQSRNLNVYFAHDEAVLRFARPDSAFVLRIEYLNANPRPAMSGRKERTGKVHYIKGRDPRQWKTHLTAYGEVLYRGLWSGIDLAFTSGRGRLEYGFLLGPGADANAIRLRYRGASGLSLDAEGNLTIHTSLGDLVDSRPVTYQIVNGRRISIANRFVLHGATEVGFAVGDYNRRLPVLIDRGVVYSTYLGGAGDDSGHAVAVDPAGHAYVTGSTYSLDFPTTAGAVQQQSGGTEDVFVTRLDRTGTALVYSTYLGGTSNEPYWAASIAVDPSGHAYITGTTLSPDFPTTPGAFQTTLRSSDAFVTKLSRDGGSLVYSTLLGGSDLDGAFNADAIAVDPAGYAYVTGFTDSPDFPTRRAYDSSFNGVEDVYVAKLNRNGTSLVFSTFIGGSSWDVPGGIAIDPPGRTYVTGYTYSADFPVRNAVQPALRGDTDAFVIKLSSAGDVLVFSTYYGGTGAFEAGYGIDANSSGTAFVAGFSDSVDFPVTPCAFQTVYGGGAADAFAAKFTATGSVAYSTYLGGSSNDYGGNVVADARGHSHIVGFTNSPDFPVTADAFQPAYRGAGPPWFTGDAFATQLDARGSDTVYSTYVGGSLDETGWGIALHPSGRIFLTGSTNSFDFPVANAFDPTFNGAGPPYFYGDAFVVRLAPKTRGVQGAPHVKCPEMARE